MNYLQAMESQLPAEVDTLTAEINVYKQQAGACIVEIGRRLIRAKELLPHGEWAKWLAEKVDFSEKSAQNFMRVAREYANPQPVADLGLSKALLLLQVPEAEREAFLEAPHTVNGEEKTVQEMSKRELEKALKERDEALKAAETAKSEAEKWRNTSDAQKPKLKNAKEKAETAAVSAAAVQQELSESRKEREALAQKIREMEEAAKAEPIQAEVVPTEETLQRIREEILAEQRQALRDAESKTAELEEKLRAARNPAALRVSIWFSEMQDLSVKIETALLELHNQQPDAAYKFRDAIAAFHVDRGKAIRGGAELNATP